MKQLKYLVRDLYAQALYGVGRSRFERVAPGRLLILTFHRVLPEALASQYPIPALAITPAELRWVLDSLLPHFDIDTVSGAFGKLRSGATSAKPLLALSFDDGQLDNLEHAAPVLAQFGVAATFYLPTDFIGSGDLLWHDAAAFAWRALAGNPAARSAVLVAFELAPSAGDTADLSVDRFLALLKRVPAAKRAAIVEALKHEIRQGLPGWARLMTWPEVTDLARAGHEIGSHGCSHDLLPQLDIAGQRAELEESMSVIHAQTHRRPESFCYPNGSFDARTLELVAAAGYHNAVTTRWGINASSQPQLELLRCDISSRQLVDRHGSLSLPRLALRLTGHQPGLTRFDGRIPAQG